jgi:oligopeptide/dipeptide ABC transporter ATP-binding protein
MMQKSILEVENIIKYFNPNNGILSSFKGNDGIIPAVDGVSFYIKENETMGLVGESGCGKTTIGRIILRLTNPTSGRVVFDGRDITSLTPGRFRPLRKQIQMIFQDLDAALNPKMRIRDILKEAIKVHHQLGGSELECRMSELLENVNLKKGKLSNFPYELSGGEKRRVGIERALAVGARFLVADEPTRALDVSIQAQVINLLKDLQKNLGLSYLFISHDLRIVELMSHKVAVMYLGKIVETGLTDRIANNSRHPYTNILWSSLVEKHSRESKDVSQKKEWGVFDFARPRSGCRFAPRCPVYKEKGRPSICTDPDSEPQICDIGNAHQVACHFPHT